MRTRDSIFSGGPIVDTTGAASNEEDYVTTTKAVAVKESGTFRMECAIRCTIAASAERIWSLLTDPPRFPSWNSTVTSLEGPIALGETLKIQVKAAPGRVFKPKVTAFDPNKSMVWSDGMAPMFKGVRTYTLTPGADGSTEFAMVEVFSGLMLPMIKGSLPDFGPIFEAYADDLKRAAEAPEAASKGA
jgi:hypothetical protein